MDITVVTPVDSLAASSAIMNEAPRPPWRQRPDIRRIVETIEAWVQLTPESALLEIGPFDKPLFDRTRCKVSYVDYFDTATLRQRAARNPNRDPAAVVELDYVLGGQRISEVVDRRFDYVVASHVLEHVPNLFGWLRDVSKIMPPGGQLLAVIPDRRYTFDIDRPPTSLGELVENDRLDVTRPSMRQVFDQRFYHKNVSASQLWRDPAQHTSATPRTFTIEQAAALMSRAAEEYVDVHCNLFEPSELVECIDGGRALKLHPFVVTELRPTERGFLDFIARLELKP